jgi:histidyl-tRNA synthetase
MFKGALPGFRDFYPQELAERAFVMRTWREVARRYAFVEYDGPPLEPLELYTKKSGDEIVGQLYTFTDKGGRNVALRPEMTPTVARMVAARANALRKPVRWFSMPQLFRYERQQRGRLREHYQLNVDIFGEADVTADAELLAVCLDIMRAFGLGPDDVVARVSDRRILQAYLLGLGVPEGAVDAVYAIIDKLERTPDAVSATKLAELGLPPRAVEGVLGIRRATIEDVSAALHDSRQAERTNDFQRYLGYLRALGVSDYVQFDLSIVRGLAYYTGIVFEVFDRRGELRAIAGGGRYDNLLSSLGGEDMPALGFGMGDVVLSDLLRAKSLLQPPESGPDVWLGADESTSVERVMAEAARRRAQGESVEFALRPQSLSKQKKAAQAAGARHFVTLSNDDGTNG